MIKVLQFIHGLNMGGAETLVKEYILGLDKTKFKVMLLCFKRCDTPYEKMLEDAGITIIYIDNKIDYNTKWKTLERIRDCIRRFILIRKTIKKIRPDILHTHMQINEYIKFARPKRPVKIFHTVHNEPQKLWFDGNFKNAVDFNAAKWLVKKYNMKFITLHKEMCQEVNDLFHINNSIVLNNGIEFDKFDKTISVKHFREKLGIPEDAFVVGHIGRFSRQKNQEFLVEIFEQLYKINSNAFLLMIGLGENKENIEEKLKSKGLSRFYKILSNRTDIPDILKIMNAFVFPSLYEGVPITLVEAQKAGIPCFVSENVSDAVKISNLINYLSLDLSAEEWAKAILNYKKSPIKYYGIQEWDMKVVIKHLENIYEKT